MPAAASKTVETLRSQLFVTAAEAAAVVGLSKTGFDRVKNSDGFPKPVTLPGRTTPMYRVSALIQWADAQLAAAS